MILKPHVLDYWRTFQPGIGLEEKHFLDVVEPRFNRLTVFDPRFPHGVRPVAGTRDPLKGRLVRKLVENAPAPIPSTRARSYMSHIPFGTSACLFCLTSCRYSMGGSPIHSRFSRAA